MKVLSLALIEENEDRALAVTGGSAVQGRALALALERLLESRSHWSISRRSTNMTPSIVSGSLSFSTALSDEEFYSTGRTIQEQINVVRGSKASVRKQRENFES